MTEPMQSISFPVPISLRDTMLKQLEEKGVQATNQRVINALKFAFTDNVIPFADEYDDEAQWATKEDVENWIQPVMDDQKTILDDLKKLLINLDRLEETVNYVCDRFT